jgi:molybdate transport system permease protein
MGALAGIMLFLLVTPILALLLRVIVGALGGSLPMLDRPVITAAGLSLLTTAISTILIALLGTPLAYAFSRYRFPLKSVLNVLVELPIVMPPVVAGLALLIAFGRRGLLGGLLAQAGIGLPFTTAAVILAQVFVSAPFYVRAAQTRFTAIPRELEEAASIDGANGWQVFRNVVLPLSWQAMTIGLILAWARALGEFGATILFAGNLQGRTQTMPLLVYGALERDIDAALWSGALLIGMAAGALGLMRWLARRFTDVDENADVLSGR